MPNIGQSMSEKSPLNDTFFCIFDNLCRRTRDLAKFRTFQDNLRVQLGFDWKLKIPKLSLPVVTKWTLLLWVWRFVVQPVWTGKLALNSMTLTTHSTLIPLLQLCLLHLNWRLQMQRVKFLKSHHGPSPPQKHCSWLVRQPASSTKQCLFHLISRCSLGCTHRSLDLFRWYFRIPILQ